MNFYRIEHLIIFLTLTCIGCYVKSASAQQTTEKHEGDNDVVDIRLPKTIIPVNYDILLMPYLKDDFRFEGVVIIEVLVQEDTDTIVLHRGDIDITRWSVSNSTGSILVLPNTTYDPTTEKYTMVVDTVLQRGSHVNISFTYEGKLRDDMIGFYKSSYIDSDGRIRWLAATQFQTTHARHAFPCFDEPSFKASFIIRILQPSGYNCLSNMPLVGSTLEGDKTFHEFEQSIPMSTYLVAFIISDFRPLGVGTFNVWARPNAIDQARYAIEIGPKSLDYLAKLFKQDYQISKMDMAAVPDFSAGAMENWGLITYRESRMLYDQSMSSDASKQSVASVIVHELTHMWFGNQVTPEWWGYLWLSEAFARYFQYFGTAQIEKTWNMEKQFIVEQHQTALAADGLESSKPMTRNVLTHSQIGETGDTITYNKGASVVRMMSLIFGNDLFEAGLQNYLKNNKEKKVARPENLWTEFQNELNRRDQQLVAPVDEIMTTWTEQAGYPVLLVDIKNGVATVRQKRFLLRNLKRTPTNMTWWVPITWASKSNPNFNTVNVTYWMNKAEDTFKVGNDREWVILNVQAAGFYRVTYDKASWYRIIDVLNSTNYESISDVNRAAIVDDLLNLPRSGLLDYKTALDGLQYIKQETNYLPFKSAFSGLTYLDRRFSGHNEYYELFKNFVLTLIGDIYKKLGFDERPDDDRLTVQLRSELNKWACNYGHEGCVQTFTKKFQMWKSTKNSTIKPNQRPAAYCTAIRHGTKADWEFLWEQYYNSNSASEQAVILQALGCTRDSSLLERYLLSALTSFEKNRIRKQDSTSVFSAVSGSGYDGAVFTLNFVDKHHAEMKEYYNGTDTITSILSSASQGFSTQQSVDKFEDLINNHQSEFKDIMGSLNNSLDIAKYELLQFNSFKDEIKTWINDYNNRNERDIETGYRLPKNVVPLTYFIDVEPNIEEGGNQFTFSGSVKIAAQIKERTKSIVLHSSNLVHKDISVFVENKKLNTRYSTSNKYDFLTIAFDEELTVGEKVDIVVDFEGTLNDRMRGFYRSWYADDMGKKRFLAATHMEPVGAREMFPCFDEPALKAKFTMRVTVPKDYNAISNTRIDTIVKHKNEKKTITFVETPKMSTYLVALVVSDFHGETDSGIYTVWARPTAIDQTQYPLSVMEPVVRFFENALNSPYQLIKLDMVALPDFASGAMENWGLLTYKERNLLYLPLESTRLTKQSITNVITHEIAHQWFGDMVSPAWWNYIWLNEGFARYFQYFGTATIRPSWGLESQFVVDHLHTALNVDSSSSSHAMTHDVESPAEIRAMFDTISYAKAASVIRMVRASFGDNVFFKSLQNYLAKRQYDVATPQDLFDAIKDQITDTNMRNSIDVIMNSWTTQPGYPVVHVSIKDKLLHLKQERFLMDQKETDNKIWHVPITWTSLDEPNFNNTTPKYWLTLSESSINFEKSEHLFIFNVQQSGFYRVNYDDDYWQRIITFLKGKSYREMHEINRAAIIDDLMNYGRKGIVNYDIVLSATQYMATEFDYVPWKAFLTGATHLRRHFEGRDAFNGFKQYLTGLIGPIYDKYGFTDLYTDPQVTILLKMQVRKWACQVGIGDCREKALIKYGQEADRLGMTRVQPHLRAVAYCEAAKQNDNKTWTHLWTRYFETDLAADQPLILQSLACTTNAKFLNELLEKAITKDSEIRNEDSPTVFSNIIDASLDGVNVVMEFIKSHHNEMIQYYGGDSQVKIIVSSLAKRVTTEELYSKYLDLITWLAGEHSAFETSYDSFKTAVDEEWSWAEKNIPKLHEWMEKNYPSSNYRLPKLFSPIKYNVFLSPYFEERNFTFFGKVEIEMKRLQLTSRIVVNSKNLNVKEVKVYVSKGNLAKGEQLELSAFYLNKETEMLTIFMKKFIKETNIIVEIDYTGQLNDDMEGFYRSHYRDSQGNIHWLATTQFQATYARNAFPCFDEPAFKASFIINIEKPDTYTALSNMPSAKSWESNVTGRVWETFTETPKMSSYVVAFVVFDFKPVRDAGTKVNVWSRPDMALNGDYAQIAAQRMLEFLEEKTNQSYVLPKLDLVAVPDFSMGAMENWGLATFREYGIHYNQVATTAKFVDYITTIIAHELTHMWFGNLVTCEWWENLWLNEGFAEYLQWTVSHSFRPSHGYNDLFVVDELQPAMLEDDYKSSHPMNKPVNTPSEIEDIFDGITYGKSSSVLRMLHNSFGPDVFFRAIHKYLSEHKYGNTRPKDLWKAFDDTIKELGTPGDWRTVENLMDNWTNKPGYPVVHVTRYNRSIELHQRQFSFDGIQDNGVYFWIPITVATSSKPDFTTTWTNIWLGPQSKTIYLNESEDWVLVNVQQSGFYRVQYNYDSWNSIIKAIRTINYGGIHVTNRAQIVDDSLNLARADYISYWEAFEYVIYLKSEKEYLPWKAFFNGISYLLQRSDGHLAYDPLKAYIRYLASNMYKSLGFVDDESDNHQRLLSRELILTWMCKLGHEECVHEAKQQFDTFKMDVSLGRPNNISLNARAAVYCTAMKNATVDDWNFLWDRYLAASFSSEEKTILEALGCTTDTNLLRRYIMRALNISLTPDIRKQDVDAALASIYKSSRIGLDVMLDFLIDNFEKVYKYYGEWDSVGTLFSKIVSRISTVEQLNKIRKFIQSRQESLKNISSELNKALVSAEKKYVWYTKNERTITSYLTRRQWNEEKNSGTIPSTFSVVSVTIFTIFAYMLS